MQAKSSTDLSSFSSRTRLSRNRHLDHLRRVNFLIFIMWTVGQHDMPVRMDVWYYLGEPDISGDRGTSLSKRWQKYQWIINDFVVWLQWFACGSGYMQSSFFEIFLSCEVEKYVHTELEFFTWFFFVLNSIPQSDMKQQKRLEIISQIQLKSGNENKACGYIRPWFNQWLEENQMDNLKIKFVWQGWNHYFTSQDFLT